MAADPGPAAHQAIISLGSNIDRERNMQLAVSLLAAADHVIAVSPVFETVPVGLGEQPRFLNAAVLLHTDQSPAQLKQGLLTEIEQQLERVRQPDKNAPRTIDLDISWYDNTSLDYVARDGRSRHIPDPDLTRYVHVALPIAELLGPDAVHPETGERILDLARRLERESRAETGPSIWKREDIDLSRHTER